MACGWGFRRILGGYDKIPLRLNKIYCTKTISG
jgi:hypothetical protein